MPRNDRRRVVSRAARQSRDHRFRDCRAKRRRDHRFVDRSCPPVDDRTRILSVPREQLVASFTCQYHRDVLAREHRDEVQRHARRVRDRLVFVPHQTRECREEVVVVDHDFVGVRPDGPRDRARILQLAEPAIREGHGERVHRPIDFTRHQRGDGAAVDAARQKHPQRDVRHQTQPHGLPEQRAELVNQCGVAGPFQLRIRTVERQLPVTLGSDASIFESQPMSGEKLVDPFEHRLGARRAAGREDFGKHRAIRSRRDEPTLQDGFDLGGKQQPIVCECPGPVASHRGDREPGAAVACGDPRCRTRTCRGTGARSHRPIARRHGRWSPYRSV